MIDLNKSGAQWEPARIDLSTFLAEALNVLRENGLEVDAASLDTSGNLVRCPLIEKPKGKDGSYWVRTDARPTAWWMNYVTGDSGCFGAGGCKVRLTDEDRAQIEAERQRRAEETAREQERAAGAAMKFYELASQEGGTTHPYAVRKGLDFGHQVKRRKYLGHDCLIVPLYSADGPLMTVQAIGPNKVFDGNRDKTLFKGGKKEGSFFPVGPTFIGAARVGIAEGLATAAAIHAATGLPCLMAVDKGNLVHVARVVRELAAPGAEIIVFADDDQPDPDGIAKAEDAARAVGGVVAVPAMGKKADFWDVWHERGPEAVRTCIEGAAAVEVQRFEVLDRDAIMERPDTAYIIKPLIPDHGVTVIHGPSGTNKSFLAIDQAAHIAEGRAWFDDFRVKRRTVAFLVLEGMGGIKRRIQAWERHHGRRFPPGVKFLPAPVGGFDLREEHDVEDLIARLRGSVGPGAVLYIDTLAQAMPGSEESNKDYGQALVMAGRIERAIEGAVILLAHPGKDPTKGIRGGYALFCGLDANLELIPVAGEPDLTMWCARKVKDGEAGIERRFRRVVVDLGTDADGDPVTSCVIVPDKEADQAAKAGSKKAMTKLEGDSLASFKQAAMECGEVDAEGRFSTLPLEEWRNHFYLASTASTQGSKRSAFNKAKSALIKGGWMTEDIYGNLSLAGPGAEVHAGIIAEAILEKSKAYPSVPDRTQGVPGTLPEAIRRTVPYPALLRAGTGTHGPGCFSEDENNSERTAQESSYPGVTPEEVSP